MAKPLLSALTSLFILSSTVVFGQISPLLDKPHFKKKDYVIRRELRTIPGELFNKKDTESCEINPANLIGNCSPLIPDEEFTREKLVEAFRELFTLNYFYSIAPDSILNVKYSAEKRTITYIVKMTPYECVTIGEVIKKTLVSSDKKDTTKHRPDSAKKITGTVINTMQEKQTVSLISSVTSKVYPNPCTDGMVNLQLNELPAERVLFCLYDLSGRAMRQQKITDRRTNLSLAGLLSGMYFYYLVDEKGRIYSSGKLVKI